MRSYVRCFSIYNIINNRLHTRNTKLGTINRYFYYYLWARLRYASESSVYGECSTKQLGTVTLLGLSCEAPQTEHASRPLLTLVLLTDFTDDGLEVIIDLDRKRWPIMMTAISSAFDKQQVGAFYCSNAEGIVLLTSSQHDVYDTVSSTWSV